MDNNLHKNKIIVNSVKNYRYFQFMMLIISVYNEIISY